MNANELEKLRKIVEASDNVVFFGGAGVSTGSGIPDFRGTNGLYAAPDAEDDPPEYLLSHTCLVHEPVKFFRYYYTHMLYPDAKPNAAHNALAELERRGKLRAVVTQNIDGLHHAAGSKNVFELHGTTSRNHCAVCGKEYPPRYGDGKGPVTVPLCSCGGVIRPDVVLYGEGLDGETFERAAEAIARADVLLVGGTSLTVQPAASLVGLYRGAHFILINLSETPYDGEAEFLIREPLETVLPQLL